MPVFIISIVECSDPLATFPKIFNAGTTILSSSSDSNSLNLLNVYMLQTILYPSSFFVSLVRANKHSSIAVG